MILEVLQAGLAVTVQGPPRTGQQSIGIPAGGPLDPVAAVVLQTLLGNPPSASLLELPGGITRLKCSGSGHLAWLGTGHIATVSDRSWSPGTVVAVRDAIIDIRGLRPLGPAYLGVAGTWRIPEVLGSTATDLRNGLGGLSGRALQRGDRIHIDAPDRVAAAPPTFGIRWPPGDDQASPIPLIVHDESMAASLFAGPLRVHPDSNRQALVLIPKTPIAHSRQTQVSRPQWAGAIQALPDGRYALLGPEAQTIGGYPLAGTLCAADLPRLGRVSGGASIEFVPMSLDEAARRSRAHVLALDDWLAHIADRRWS